MGNVFNIDTLLHRTPYFTCSIYIYMMHALLLLMPLCRSIPWIALLQGCMVHALPLPMPICRSLPSTALLQGCRIHALAFLMHICRAVRIMHYHY